MDRKQFISELRSKLAALPNEEREKAISYYEEYFDDAGTENEESVVYELGDVERIAQEIIENSTSNANSVSVNKFTVGNDNSYKDNTANNNNKTNNFSKVETQREKQKLKPLYVILIIIGALACFPLIMTLIGLIFGLFGMIIGVIATAFGLVISGIAAIFTIPFAGVAVVGGILYYLGKGILSFALLLIIIIVIVKLIKVVIDFIRNRAN